VLTLSTGRHSIYEYLAYLPGFNAIRAVTRIILVMLLPVALLVALGADTVIAIATARSRAAGAATALFLLALVSWESTAAPMSLTPISLWRDHIERASRLLPKPLSPDAVLSLRADPKIQPEYVTELDAMILAQDYGLATINGYSGNSPDITFELSDCTFDLEIFLEKYLALRHRPPAVATAIRNRIVRVDLHPCDATANGPGR
jgi:hypothetical protein